MWSGRFLWFRRFLCAAAVCASPLLVYGEETDGEQRFYPVIIEFSQLSDIDEMEEQGIIVLRHRDNMALAFVPDGEGGSSPGGVTRRLARVKGVRRFERSRKAVPALDIARKRFGADRINAGEGLESPYTGKGVVVGFCDTGFDPLHISFLDADGNPRVKRMVSYDELHGIRRVMDSRSELEEFRTDRAGAYHATHVAGIIAGSCEGSPYTGMAPEAEIVATTSSLYDVGLLAGAEDVIEYAQSQGKPCVINMSVGSYAGPHDGTTLFNRYLSLLGREAIICMAAGNEGQSNNVMRCEFSEARQVFRTRIHASDWLQFDMYGTADCWSDDSRPFRVRMMVLDEQAYYSGVHDGSEIVYELPEVDCSEDFSISVESATDPEFAKYYTGWIELYGGTDPRNGRRYVTVNYDAHTEAAQNNGKWARYVLVIEAQGEPGTSVDVFSDSVYSRFTGFYNSPAPTSWRSVSDLATGDNIVCVGMYNNRETVPHLGYDDGDTKCPVGFVNPASGYGTLVDGRVLPHTVSPGGALISSFSTPFVEGNPDMIPWMCHSVTRDGKTWYWGLEGGTSMATPYVAGCIATWLEANPALGIEDVHRILTKTNLTEYENNPDDPRHGQGWFRPYDGILSAIELRGIGSGMTVTDDSDSPRLTFSDGTITVWNPSARPVQVEVVSLSGIRVFSTTAAGTTAEIRLPSLAAGIYMARIPGSGASLKVRI